MRNSTTSQFIAVALAAGGAMLAAYAVNGTPGSAACPHPTSSSIESLFAPCQANQDDPAPGQAVASYERSLLRGLDTRAPPVLTAGRAAAPDVETTGSIERR